MNMLYEGLKHNATIVIVPSTAVETMQLGTVAGLTALTKGLGDERANKEQAAPQVHGLPLVLRNHKTKMSLKRCVTAQFVCSIGIAPATVELGKEALPTLSR
jgi:hypothetical protein